jgi:hypothetical protein
MVLSWGIFILLLVGIAGVWFWQDSMQCRERANQAAAAACENMQLQFLDGTVAFTRLGLVRGKSGWLTFQRTYVFDYTADSIARRQGFVVMQAHTLSSIGFASHDVPAPESKPPPPQPPSAANQGNVLYLEQWRREHRKPSLPAPSVREERGGGDSRH